MITIRAVGYQFLNQDGIDMNRKNGSGDYLFLHFRCQTEVFLDGAYQLVPENSFFLFPKDAPQIYRKKDGIFLNDWIHFDIVPYDNFFEHLELPFQTPFQIPESRFITNLMEDIYTEFFNEGSQHAYIMDQKMKILFHKLSDIYRPLLHGKTATTKYASVLHDIRKNILNYQYLPSGASEVAETLHISTSYFQHIYKELFGTSIQQDIIKGRIEHAAMLLQGTDLPVTDIAKLCGYENVEHFSRQFKAQKGCSPKQFRF